MSVKIFDTMTTATPNFPLAYAEKINIVKEDGSEADIQTLYNNGDLGSKSTAITVSQEEFDALDEQTKLENDYHCYDSGHLYYKGIRYGHDKPETIKGFSKFKEMKEAGLIDDEEEYLVEADENGILLEASDIGYSNAVSNLNVTTVQGAIDKVAEKVDGLIDDTTTGDTSTWSSSKIASEIGAKSTKTQYRGSRSVDIGTSGKLTFIYSSEYASQAGCYILLSNFNTEPLLIELGRTNIGQFSVTATHKSQSVDTITVTTAGDEYSWYVLQF